MTDAKLHDEEGRLAALRRYEVLDTPREAPFERVTGLVQAVLNVPIATISMIDADRQWYKSCVGMPDVELDRDSSFCTHTIQSREPLVIPDTLADPRFANYASVVGEPYIRSYAGVPLASPDGYNLGSLCALDRQPRDFNPGQIEVLKSFAALVVDELELRRIAQIDSLTEAATRRSFLLEVEKSIAEYGRSGGQACLLVLDVDFFKRINDMHGHPVGDIVLREVSRTLSSRLRTNDLLGRLGGEEFGILLKGADAKQGMRIADELRAMVEAMQFPDNIPSGVTVSFGVAGIAPGLKPESWLALADAALYGAKRTGRNRCCVAAGDVVQA